MELFKLFGTIAVENSEANKALEETSSKASKVSNALKKAGSKMAKVGTVMTGVSVAAGAAVLKFADSSASAADNIDKMSQKIGISREAYQELDFICSQSGTSVDGLQTGMKTLTDNMQAAQSGTASAVEKFDQLGVSIYDSNGKLKDQETVMWETISALQGMENQSEKAALATDLFGRSGTELMPLLNGAAGSVEEMKQQAHDLGLVMSDEAIDAGVEYTDAVDQLKRSFSAAAAKAGTDLLPSITNLVNLIIEKGVPFFEKLIEKVTNVVTWFTNLDDSTKKIILVVGGLLVAAGPVLTLIGGITSAIGVLIPVIGAICSPVGLVVAAIGAAIAIGVSLYKNWDKIKEKAKALGDSISEKWDNIKEKTSKAWENVKESVSGAITKAKDTVSEKVEALKEKVADKWSTLKTNTSDTWQKIKDTMSEKMGSAKDTIGTKLGNIKDSFSSKFEDAKDIVKNAIEKIKGFFNFDWSLPKLKMPHFSISGEFSLSPPSVPSIGIEWYKKAMDNPMVMDKPTAFGINPLGQIMAGGEAGSEVVSGTNTLMDMISGAVASQNVGVQALLARILDAILSLDMGENMREALEGTALQVNNREFARLVKGVS